MKLLQNVLNHCSDESAADLVTPEIWELLRVNGKIPWKSISNFHIEEYRFLSNFYEAPVEYNGLVFGDNEAAFQAQKCMTDEEMVKFTELTAGKVNSSLQLCCKFIAMGRF